MTGKLPNKNQRELFCPMLVDMINKLHEWVVLANTVDWQYFEDAFILLFLGVDAPVVSIPLMVGCLLLKPLKNLGDDSLPKAWIENPYLQYFCGMQCFEHAFSFDPSDFCHFRKWIGESGFEQVFAYSTQLHGRTAEKKAKLVLQTLLVQGNNTTFPTDAKLCKKVIDQCNKIATKDGILQRQRYPRESKQLLCYTYNDKHLKRVKQANKAVKRLKVIAGLRYVS